ncbi:MAG: GNAT family N-acetyltransferase [Verrucomicrobia bacterium]|nr:GNAT family N-acetyltransferase [Verrucomicrobiota bacterium]
MQVRRATPADARAIAEVHVASWQSAYRGLFPDSVLDNLSVAERERMWAARLVEPATIWVAGPSGQISGFVYACPSRDADTPPPAFGEIAALYVHPAAWGTGCGRALCQAALAHFREAPAQSVIVWALSGNRAARRFYESQGFVTDDGRRDITLFNVTQPEVRFRHNLL